MALTAIAPLLEQRQALAEETAAPPLPSVLETIGGTPLLRLRRVAPRGCAAIWAKLENLNPGGSVKDRICRSMIADAERTGKLLPGGTVVEPTSGNTGIGLALVCAAKGYPLVLTLPDNMSQERRALLASYGAEVVLTPAAELMEGAIERARLIVSQRQGAFMPQQFQNLANPQAHFEGTGPEIHRALKETGATPSAFVAGVGTGGTLTGVGRFLRQHHPRVRLVAVEPENCAVLSGYPPGITRIQGLGAGFVPPILDRSLIDEVVMVSDEQAWRMKVRLAEVEGLLTGISSGANVAAAIQLGVALGPAAHVVTVVCDTGERYFSLAAEFA
jgi:cysteine synthase A